MRRMMGTIGAAAVVVASVAPQTAVAAQPSRVPAYDCGALAAQLGPNKVWQTVFSASRKDAFGFPENFFAAPCFASEANCKAWLYWARSDWDPYYSSPPPCRTGLPY